MAARDSRSAATAAREGEALDIAAQEDALAAGLIAGDRRALARAITLVENETESGAAIHRRIASRPRTAHVLGFTGAPGAGKSTLINAYVGLLRRLGRTVAVVAVDPSSPFTGGALLGDRIRMIEHLGDAGVFVRSLATRGCLGGLTATVDRVVDLIAAAGWDVVIVETVGTGQSETDIHGLADVRIVVTSPDLGDHVQAMKAGILEIADVLVVNKGDHSTADRAVRDLSAMLRLRPADAPPIPVVKTVATTGAGLPELLESVEAVQRSEAARGGGDARRTRRAREKLAQEIARLAVCALVEADSAALDDLGARLAGGALSPPALRAELLRLLAGKRPDGPA